MVKDLDGTILIVAVETENIPPDAYNIILKYSTNNCISWSSQIQLKAIAATDLNYPYPLLVDGHQIICSYVDTTNGDADCVRRGVWEAYSANACPCAIEAIEQIVICNIGMVWHGGAGIAGDKWAIQAGYEYGMENVISNSQAEPWRSEQDNIATSNVIDMGTNERFFADGAAFFNCNVRTLDFQMNAANSWSVPSVDEAVSFDVTTAGVVDSADGNAIEDAALLANYKDHELAGLYLRMTSGTDNGVTWRIKDNAGDYIFLDDTAANNISASDTFCIFQGHMAVTFTGGLYEYINQAITAQHTADDYYQVGTMIAGKVITLSKGFSVGYRKAHSYDRTYLRPPGGGMIPVEGRGRKRRFELRWPAADDARKELIALLDYIEGRNICLIPDDSDLSDCYAVKLIGDVQQTHRFLTYFDVPLVFEEI